MQYYITPRIRDKGQAKAELRGSCHGKGRNIKADGAAFAAAACRTPGLVRTTAAGGGCAPTK